MNKFLGFLKSNLAVLLATIMSLTPQLWHSINAFVHLDQGGADNVWNYVFGVLFSLSTSFAILLFTVRGRRNVAYFFLAVEVFINIIHYGLLGMSFGMLFFSTLFMCLIVPITIAAYSAEIDTEEKSLPPTVDPPVTNSVPEAFSVAHKSLPFDPLEEINKLAGFDVSDPNDYSGNLPAYQKQKLKDLWKANKDNPTAALNEVRRILGKDTNKLLFDGN